MDAMEKLKRHEEEIKTRFGVKKIGIFGSYATGRNDEKSDIDILVEFNRPTFDNFMDLVFFLEDLFDREVDLVTTNGMSPYVSQHIRSEVVWCE